MGDTIIVGAFTLQEPIATGGMGTVWRAAHTTLGTPAAIKFITGEHARSRRFQRAFRREARAMATLQHPHIVRVLDHGEVDAPAAANAKGKLVSGSPYIAMELVDGGTLKDLRGQLSWTDVRQVLLRLLDALAHAHARNVLHRDLKPANVLLERDAVTWQLKLSDFGIAHPWTGETHRGPKIAGTPEFMAPEQHRGDWRLFGPATDLYALARIAVALLRTGEKAASVPRGFEDFLRQAQEPLPKDRFYLAADMREALLSLGKPEVPFIGMPVWDAPTMVEFTPQLEAIGTLDDITIEDGGTIETTLTEEVSGDLPDPPTVWKGLPHQDWRREDLPVPHVDVLNAGIGLLGLRQPELQGREEERDILWGAYRRAVKDKRATAVVLTGETGVGKRRLARWLQERAQELGVGVGMTATFGEGGFEDGLAAMMAREFRTTGLRRKEARQEITRLVGLFGGDNPLIADALTELAHPADDNTATRLRLNKPEERYGAMCAWLSWLCKVRPRILVLEDSQWGPEGIAFAEHALSREDLDLPMLLVLTMDAPAQEDEDTQPPGSTRLQRLLEHRRARRITLGPLEPEHQRRLVRGLIGLRPDLERRVVTRTQGNPLHAVQLVLGWAQARQLVPSEHGFALHDRSLMSTAANDLARARITEALNGRSEDDLQALEMAAVLGHEVDIAEWLDFSAQAGKPASEDLLDALARYGLATITGRRFTFGAGIRSALLLKAKKNKRYGQHHMRRAVWLNQQPARVERDLAIAEHLMQGGVPARAIPFLERCFERLFERADAVQGWELYGLWTKAINMVGLRPNHPNRALSLFYLARLYLFERRLDSAVETANTLIDTGRENGWRTATMQGLWVRGNAYMLMGQSGESEADFREGIRVAREKRSQEYEARCRYDLGRLWSRVGRNAAGRDQLNRAWRLHEEIGNEQGANRALVALALVTFQEGRPDEALTMAHVAMDDARRMGERTALADAHTVIGEIHRHEQRLQAAEAHYKKAIEVLKMTGTAQESVNQHVNLALVQLARGKAESAARRLEQCLEWYRRANRKGHMGVVHVLILPAMVLTNDPSGWDRHFAMAGPLLESTGYYDPDVVKSLEWAAKLAKSKGWFQRADEAEILAHRQVETLKTLDSEAQSI